MKRPLALLLVVVLILLAAAPALAEPPTDSKDTIKLKVFVHYPKPGKPAPQPDACDPTANDQVSTYGLAGWKHSGTVTYRVNYASIPRSVANAKAAITASYAVWDQQAPGTTFVEGPTTTATRYKLDGINLVSWGSVSAAGAIAVTYTWYNSVTKVVVEQDIIMNVKLPWAHTDVSNPDATCGVPTAYEVQNILTHEVGHVFGLDDLYESAEQDLTMYGYGAKGELKKETLGRGDLMGIGVLY